MDSTHFDRVASNDATPRTRRAIIRLLAALPLPPVSIALLELTATDAGAADWAGAGIGPWGRRNRRRRRRNRGNHRHQRNRHHHRTKKKKRKKSNTSSTAPPVTSCNPVTRTFDTPGTFDFTAPCAGTVAVEALGAGGGNGGAGGFSNENLGVGGSGGSGGKVTASFAVAAAERLQINVGARGQAPSSNGAGGGVAGPGGTGGAPDGATGAVGGTGTGALAGGGGGGGGGGGSSDVRRKHSRWQTASLSPSAAEPAVGVVARALPSAPPAATGAAVASAEARVSAVSTMEATE